MILLLLGLFILNLACEDKKEAYIRAVVEWHGFLLIVIYGLSFMNSLNLVWILAAYGVVNLCVWGYALRLKLLKGIRRIPIKRKDILFLIPCVMALIALAFSLVTVPYNWDSMTYHLPRLAHWAQNQSVVPYATHIDRQIGSTTLASYVSLLVYILSGKKDIFLNLVQCIAYITDAVFIYGIARKCKVNRNFSVAASVLFLAMPIAFAEATTTQNDNYSTMWLLFFVYLLIDYLDKNRRLSSTKQEKQKVAFAAFCMGFGYLAKPSVCFAMAILLCFLLWNVIRRKDHYKDILLLLGIAGLAFVLVITPQLLFNLSVFGKALPDNVGKRQLVGTLQPNYLFVGFVKNFTYNLGVSFWAKSKDYLSLFLYWLAGICNVALDHPTIAEDGVIFGYSSHPYGCDTALNPLVLILALLGVIWCLFRIKKQESTQIQFTFFAIISYIVFCTFLRWEYYISRYLVSYFALLCPAIAIQLQDLYSASRNKYAQRILIIGFCVLCAANYYYVVKNAYKIETKEYPDSYFYHIGGMKSDYLDICDYIVSQQYKEIGLIIGTNSYEYPLWGILNSKMDDFVIRHVNVENGLAQYEDISFLPDCVFAVHREGEEKIYVHGSEYVKNISHEESGLYLYEKVY